MKRARMQQEMQAEHKVTSAVRAANRRAESQLLQARQVSHAPHWHTETAGPAVSASLSLEQSTSASMFLCQKKLSMAAH